MADQISTKDFFSSYDIPTLARWEATFNAWQWPDDYPIQPPDDPDKIVKAASEQFKIMSNLDIVPLKEFLRAWNTKVRNDPMTDQEFENWWATRHPNHPIGRAH